MRRLLLLCLILTLTAQAAQADSFGLGFAGTFNAFVFNDFTATSDTEGRLAVGGDAHLSNYSVGDKLTTGQYQDVLVVGGDLTFTSGRVYGRALVGGSANLGHPNVADGGVVTGASMPFSFGQEQQRLTNLSSNLATLAATGNVTNSWGTLTLVGTGSGLEVFNVSGADLLNGSSLGLSNIATDATVIINVSGLTAGLTNMGMQELESYNDSVLFNFYEATDLDLWGVGVQGSILAPLADIEGAQGVLWGTLVANSFEGSMQLNHVPFVGKTPIPAAAWLLGSGLLGLLGIRRMHG